MKFCLPRFDDASRPQVKPALMPRTSSHRTDAAVFRRTDRYIAARIAVSIAGIIVLASCATGPLNETLVKESYSLEAINKNLKRTIGNITVEDLGEPPDVLAPVRVQACKGRRLVFDEVKITRSKGKTHTQRRPVYEEVDPFEGLYVRRLNIRNDSKHSLSLNRVEAVLLDAAGNDNVGMSKAMISRILYRERPCSSTRDLISSWRSLKVLGNNIRLRPGRTARVLVIFSRIDKSIPGDWTLQLHGFPVEKDRAGKVTHVASFEIPLVSRGYRTTIERRKETMLGPWRVIRKSREPIELNP